MTAETQTVSYESSFGETAVPQPHLFLALQAHRLLDGGLRLNLSALRRVRIGRGETRLAQLSDGATELRLQLPDERISTQHCEVLKEKGRFTLCDLGSKNGTRVNGEPLGKDPVPLQDGAVIELGRSFLVFRSSLAAERSAPPTFEAASDAATPGLSTLLPQLGAHFAELKAVASSTLPVLVRGETGTGKELAAAALHDLSQRSGAFVPVNCGAIPHALVASELFGYRKGAFSGADEDRSGLVRSADRGTLFLDEIGELHKDAQAALLRVLQESEVLPLGGTRPVKVDVRVVAATHRDLEAMVASGDFRGDLLARLAGFTLRLPPLRARREDVGLVLGAILRRKLPGRAEHLTLRTASARRLFAAPFSRNIRELERAVVTAAALSQDSGLELSLEEAQPAAAVEAAEDADLEGRLKALLTKHAGNVSAVAAELGKARMQIHRWMKRFELDPEAYRKPADG